MESIVPPEISAELTQILSNLVLGDNDIRANAERTVNERLSQAPDLYLLALAQGAIMAEAEVMRSFSLVLLRRLLFRPAPTAAHSTPAQQLPSSHAGGNLPRVTLYDALPPSTLESLERLLLSSLSREYSRAVRRKTVDTVCDLANEGMKRGRGWHALQAQSFSMSQAGLNTAPSEGSAMSSDNTSALRESAHLIFAGCPLLVMDLQTDAVLGVFRRGLEDAGVEVRHAALRASVSYLSEADSHQLSQSLALMYPILDTLPALASGPIRGDAGLPTLSTFLHTLLPLTSSHPTLFAPHLPALLRFLPPLILPSPDAGSGPTPTVARPFTFPPTKEILETSEDDKESSEEVKEARTEVRLAALEFMLALSEAKPGMVKGVDGWVAALVRGCLEGMGEVGGEEAASDDGESELQIWLEADPSDDPTDDTYPHVYEQSLDRLSCAVGGKAVLPPSFLFIPSMLASYDWRQRHAGCMAIAALGEGSGRVMQHELAKVVDLILPMFADSHPRVRYAACQCVGQLCTDLEELIQAQFHEQLFRVLIPTLEAAEPRVHSHAASALINFCEGVERDTLIPYLDPIVERLLKLLNPDGQVKRYVQEQAITTLAMVADASETTFAKHYGSIMPLLLNVLRNAEGPDFRKLRVKAMECAGLIAIAVGRDVFRPDANTFVELLMRIQNSPVDPGDTLLGHYLISTWAKICQAMGPEFEPYLPVVMPPLIASASAKPDVSVYDEHGDVEEERDGWETIHLDGQIVGIKTSAIEEKCQAFETLVIYCSTLQARFGPYLHQVLELTLPGLRFYFHDGVREACAMLIPMLLSCGKASGTLTNPMVTATFRQLSACITTESDASFLASLFKCMNDCLRVVGGFNALPQELHDGVIDATKRQLQTLADRRKHRAQRPAEDLEEEREDLALLEEMEDFALEEMGIMLRMRDPAHPLLIAVSGVRELGFNRWNEDDEENK